MLFYHFICLVFVTFVNQKMDKGGKKRGVSMVTGLIYCVNWPF
jgi:hypothetical protein